MKKIILILILFTFIFPNIDATTKDGKSVLLKPDGTWEFINKNKNIDSNDFGMWEIRYFVDEFGDPTSQGYIEGKKRIYGTFSNSATTNDDLGVEFIIDKGRFYFQLFEYNRTHSVKGNISSQSYKIQVKHNGKVVKGGRKKNKDFRATNYSDRLKVNYPDDLINLFSQGGEFKFSIIETGDYANGSYKFTVNDVSGFSNAYKKLTNE
jgi:hypothetical protein